MTNPFSRRVPVAITVGDFNGIGPEVALKSIIHPSVRAVSAPLLVGPSSVFRYYARSLGIPLRLRPIRLSQVFESNGLSGDNSDRRIPVLETYRGEPPIHPGVISKLSGRIAGEAIGQAVHLAQYGVVDAVVTAPVSKRALHKAGLRFPGQTEMLQELTCAPRVGMMLVSPTMRIGLVTIHTPINNVSPIITRSLLRERINLFYHALVSDWAIGKPRIAVLGLNPHAGEDGDIGTEDERIVKPVVSEIQEAGLDIRGPFSADAFFARYRPGTFDAVIAMYHDQGLIPLKMSSFGKAVNVSVGLPVIRTSPDHGTAFDIAGKGIANPGSMIEAIKLACLIRKNRERVLAASVDALMQTFITRRHSR